MRVKLDISFPEKWEDISEDQFKDLSRLLIKNIEDREEFLVKLGIAWCGFGYTMEFTDKSGININYKGKIFHLRADQLVSITEKCSFVLDNISRVKCLKRIGDFYGSDSDLYDVSLEQFWQAELYYLKFALYSKVNDLNSLCAVFYTPKNKNWDQKKHNAWSKNFNNYTLVEKYTVYLWYTGVKAWIKNKYPYVFGGGEASEMPNMAEIALNMMGALNLGDVTKNSAITKVSLHEALSELNKKIEHAENLEK